MPKAKAPPEDGLRAACSSDKYYVDEIYDAAIVTPVVEASRGLLWRGVDKGLIDGLGVNGSAYLSRVRRVAWVRSCRSGRLGTYAWVLDARRRSRCSAPSAFDNYD